MGEGCNLDAKGFVSRLEYIKKQLFEKRDFDEIVEQG